jgi:hypothetical protein
MNNSGGGQGRGPFGGMPHGGSSPESFNAEEDIIYPPIPFGVPLCSIPLEAFSGELDSGLLAGSHGQVFISPALLAPNSGNNVDITGVLTRVTAEDGYYPPQTPNPRPFLLGPPPPPSLSDLIALANSLKLEINDHEQNFGGPFHVIPDGINTIIAPNAVDLATAIVLLDAIRPAYEAHRVLVGFFQVHLIPDSVNAIVAAPAVDLVSAVALANDLRSKYNLHNTQVGVHPLNDLVNFVTPDIAFPPQFSTSYKPVLNSGVFALLNTRPQVRGIMHDTISGDDTVILY